MSLAKMAEKYSKEIYCDPTSVFKLPERFEVLPRFRCCFPNYAELLTYKILACSEKLDFSEITEKDAEFSTYCLEKMTEELEFLAKAIYSSSIGGPDYFIVTVAEHGAFLGNINCFCFKSIRISLV